MKVVKQSDGAPTAVGALLKGEVIICPTDTVYGFLADATNKKAVEKIYQIKQRPKGKPLPVFVSDIKMAYELAEINERQIKYLKRFWPGAYTVILKRKRVEVGPLSVEARPLQLYGVDAKTIALRIPKHPFLQKLLKKVNRPLVQTSVNLTGREPLDSAEQIMATFGKSKFLGLIITSSKPLVGKSSRIIDLIGKKVVKLRH